MLIGVKRSQGSPAARHFPITDSLLLVIHRALDLNIFYHCAFWAACMLGYFGFLGTEEFTIPNLARFSPAIHLLVEDIAVDSLQSRKQIRSVRVATSILVRDAHLSAQFRHCWPTSPCEEMSLAPYSHSCMVNLCLAQS